MVRGTDTLLASAPIGGSSDARKDVLCDQDFIDMIYTRDDMLNVAIASLHEQRPISADVTARRHRFSPRPRRAIAPV